MTLPITLPLFPDHRINISYFSSVTNAATILASLKSLDPNYNYCFLDARRVVSLEQVLFAIMRALQDAKSGNMRTKTLYSQVVYSMSPNQNISEALKRFGIADDSTALICLAIDSEIDPPVVQGIEEEVTSDTFLRYCDLNLTKSIYKLDKKLTEVEEIRVQVISSIAMRGHL